MVKYFIHVVLWFIGLTIALCIGWIWLQIMFITWPVGAIISGLVVWSLFMGFITSVTMRDYSRWEIPDE